MILLPTPRHLMQILGTYRLSPGKLILLSGADPQVLRRTARRFQDALLDQLHFTWEVIASEATPPDLIGLDLRVNGPAISQPQGYRLDITPQGIRVEAADEAGAFYAVCTLAQIVEENGADLPALSISDWPDFPVRGVMLDISRDKVPTMETMYSLVDLLAGWKINQLQLYTEHTFAYQQHPEVWAGSSPFTGQEILELEAFCKERQIELVPNQNSFGHMHRWLKHPRYAHLSEVKDGYDTPWGREKGTNSLCPIDPGSLELIRSMYDELLPHFSSRMFNAGCDETFDVGQGRSREACEYLSPGRVYLEFLLNIYQEVASRGRILQYWGDIVIQHPDLIHELPKNAIALEWGYEADHPFDAHGAIFAKAGLPFYVCPGTSSWSSLSGRSDNAIANLTNAAENGLKHGASGYLITDWGDYGHWQPLPISYLGFAAGAAYSWALSENRSLDLPQALNHFAFRDRAEVMGCLAYNLGNIYMKTNVVWLNASPLFSILQRQFSVLRNHPKIRVIPYELAQEAIQEAISPLTSAQMNRPDAALIKREFDLSARLSLHACRRGRLAVSDGEPKEIGKIRHVLDLDMQEILTDYESIWLERNRPGGLADSMAKLAKTRSDYLQGEIPTSA